MYVLSLVLFWWAFITWLLVLFLIVTRLIRLILACCPCFGFWPFHSKNRDAWTIGKALENMASVVNDFFTPRIFLAKISLTGGFRQPKRNKSKRV